MSQGRLTRRQMLQASAVAIASGLAGCGGGGDDSGDDEPEVEADETVTMGGESHLSPQTVNISAGQTVLWVIEDAHHQLIRESQPDEADWNPPSTNVLTDEETYSNTFSVPGTYEYSCNLHIAAENGVIEVTE